MIKGCWKRLELSENSINEEKEKKILKLQMNTFNRKRKKYHITQVAQNQLKNRKLFILILDFSIIRFNKQM